MSEAHPKPSRADIELHCLLHAIGAGATGEQLVRTLGLSGELAVSLHRMVAVQLVPAGYVEDQDGVLSLTPWGQQVHREALGRWGV